MEALASRVRQPAAKRAYALPFALVASWAVMALIAGGHQCGAWNAGSQQATRTTIPLGSVAVQEQQSTRTAVRTTWAVVDMLATSSDGSNSAAHAATGDLHGSSGSASDGSSSGGGREAGSVRFGPGPLVSQVDCEVPPLTDPSALRTKETDLQQLRRVALALAGGQPAGGYVALCLAVKNQHRELPEWLEYYKRMGVSQIYAMEDQQTEPPLDDVLQPHVKSGLVTHVKVPLPAAAQADLLNTTCREYFINHKQLHAYAYCLRDFGARHQWMGFIDPDEYLALTDGTPSLPDLLKDYEAFGGVGFNWRMFGSSGHLTRQNNTLLSYTKCNLQDNLENTHMKVFANMAYVARMGGPHDAAYAPGYYTVTPNRRRVDGPTSTTPDFTRAALNHYILRSKEEFQEKMKRGSAMSKPKTWEYWNVAEAAVVAECDSGVKSWERLFNEGKPAPAGAAGGKAAGAAAGKAAAKGKPAKQARQRGPQ